MEAIWSYEFSPGQIFIGEKDGNITYLGFHEDDKRILNYKKMETPLIKDTKIQLTEYFEGKRKDFDLPLSLYGTDFQKSVWKALEEIPYGQTCSYKDIAIKIGKPKAARAVGMANNRNPISIIIPCHRVIGHNGSLIGYGGGLSMKKVLLNLEQANIE